MELFINNLGNIIKLCSRNGLPTLCGEIFLMKKKATATKSLKYMSASNYITQPRLDEGNGTYRGLPNAIY